MSAHNFKPNVDEAELFLTKLASQTDDQFTFQTFDDCQKGKGEKRRYLARVFNGTLKQHIDELTHLNQQGAGVFVTINKTNGTGRSKENIIALRAVFADKDDGICSDFNLVPSIDVLSKRGNQPYWVLKPGEPLSQFALAQKALQHHLKSDPSVFDLPRVMRLPGFLHLKDPEDPFLVRVIFHSNNLYSIGEVLRAYPSKKDYKPKGDRENENSGALRFEKWVNSLSIEPHGANPLGGRNNTVLCLVREGLARNIDRIKLLQYAADYCRRSGKDASIAAEILERQIKKHEEAPFEPFFLDSEKCPTSGYELANGYLLHRKLIGSGGLSFRYYQGDFYKYENCRYVKVPRSDLRADVVSYLQSNEFTQKKAGPNLATNVLANLEALTLVASSVQIPEFLSQAGPRATRLIPLKNCVLDLEKVIRGDSEHLIDHSPLFFSLSCLPFEYDQKASCPTWVRFLSEVIPDQEIQNFVQEWFGYNLVFDTSYHKFVLLVGEGANGKSVVCVVLRSLLGQENVSAVPFEQFNSTRTFPLAATFGKLANIVQEMGESDKGAESTLKDFIGGDLMTVERKHKDPFEFKPTARCTFATNVLPRFKDRSNGIWRRVITIPFITQIPEAQQDKRFAEATFWERCGELPGIFNWAIEGLIRLKRRGYFIEPAACFDLKAEFRQETNPAGVFLNENCAAKVNSSVASNCLYRAYAEWMRNRGCSPLGEPQFSKEVRRAFSQVELTKNPLRQADGSRSREWVGVDLLDGKLTREREF